MTLNSACVVVSQHDLHENRTYVNFNRVHRRKKLILRYFESLSKGNQPTVVSISNNRSGSITLSQALSKICGGEAAIPHDKEYLEFLDSAFSRWTEVYSNAEPLFALEEVHVERLC